MNLDLYIEKVISIAREAGENILDFYEKYKNQTDPNEFTINTKSDNSPVTNADLSANKIISDALNELTPEILVVSEEDPDSWEYRKHEKIFWLIDPLDGTKEFLNKNDEFTVNIALIENGKPIFGVIYAPVFNQMYWGGRKLGSFKYENHTRSELRIKEGSFKKPHELKILASKSHFSKEVKSFIESLNLPYKIMHIGSSLKLCRVAEGYADLYPRLNPTSEWDTAAGQAILEGAGGFVIQLNGYDLKYGKSEVLNPGFIAGSIPLEILIKNILHE